MAVTPEATRQPSAGLTYEDYLQLPDSEGGRYEILDGDLAMTPSPRIRHQEVSGNLFRILDRHILKLYARYEVAHYWIVDPDGGSVELYEHEAGAYRLASRAEDDGVARSSLFPGLEMAVREICAS